MGQAGLQAAWVKSKGHLKVTMKFTTHDPITGSFHQPGREPTPVAMSLAKCPDSGIIFVQTCNVIRL